MAAKKATEGKEVKAKQAGKRPKAQPRKPEKAEAKKEIVFTVGKRKTAVARARLKPGKGVIKINSTPLELVQPEMMRLRMQEPLMIAGDLWKGFDMKVDVRGGGVMSQAEAVRQAMAKGLVEYFPDLRAKYLEYDRNLLVYDPRRAEQHKPPHSSWGARRYKQRSKR
ncbi:MAG: 30S ribosomal protein S9 [Candidatus Aenigmarchaeota archaeon]|nr:30S ribosomal protein S9 [Candidatus Aenigmarchaeota archaeon]